MTELGISQTIFSFLAGNDRCASGSHSQVQECCDTRHPCGEGQGDCDKDSECSGSLVCGRNNCDRSEFSSSRTDCCEKPYLIWPCSGCQIGPAHTSSGKGDGVMSAIDMAPNLYNRWKQHEDNSGGYVYAAHDGWVYHDSLTWQCGLKIKSSNGLETHYLHMTDLIDQTDWNWYGGNYGGRKYVLQGARIGRIAMTKGNSNCPDACNSFDENCSTGPHLHFELLQNGKPRSLNGVTIGGIRNGITIQKLSESANANYDEGCGENDENCLTIFKIGGKKYHPYYNGSKGGGFSFNSQHKTPCHPFFGC